MGQDEKPTPIESVDPTFGMSEEEAVVARHAARMRHPAFNPKVYQELIQKALNEGAATTEPIEETDAPATNAQVVKNLRPHTTMIDGRRTEGVEISDDDGEKPL